MAFLRIVGKANNFNGFPTDSRKSQQWLSDGWSESQQLQWLSDGWSEKQKKTQKKEQLQWLSDGWSEKPKNRTITMAFRRMVGKANKKTEQLSYG